jgi:hypothetical protein
LWRFAGDRVLTRRREPPAADVEADLAGVTALVWLALDRPQRQSDLAAALAEAGVADPDEVATTECTQLVANRLIIETASG